MTLLTDCVSELDAVLERLCAADPHTLCDGDTVLALDRLGERLKAVQARVSAAFAAGDEWRPSGALSAAAWLSVRTRQPKAMVAGRVRLGRELRSMPVVEEAWLCGEINESHVRSMAKARTPGTEEVFARDEDMLVGYARRLRFGQFIRALTYWSWRADPNGAENRAKKDFDSRSLHVSQSFGDCFFLNGKLDPIGGTIVARALKAIEEELFLADWAEAKARVGDGVCAADLTRTAPQRRADALVEMARRSQAMPAGARLPEPLFTVVVGYETFKGMICELGNRTVVTPGSLIPWLDEAWVERVVYDGPDRVMNVGQRRRLFTGATRQAVKVRDKECFHDFCDVPAEDCEVDHVLPWSEGGLTVETNGRPACGPHNRSRSRSTAPSPAPRPPRRKRQRGKRVRRRT